jgi:pimeloyl-ACP methyl ester carboxylesterase
MSVQNLGGQTMSSFDITTSRDGTTIAYEVAGDGPPLVYVTGAICHRTFRPIRQGTAVLSRAFRVMSFDRRGRGDSSDTAPWSLDREVEDLESLIDALGGHALVYGHSSGAVLALHAAHRLAPKVQRVVLYDASWVADEAGAARYATLRAEVEELLDQERRAAAIKHFLVGIGMPKLFATALPFMPGWRRLVELAPTLRYDMSLTAAPPPMDVATQVRVPVHVMIGERSPEELHRVADALARAIPGATRETLAGQDHMVSEKVLLPSLVRHLSSSQETV